MTVYEFAERFRHEAGILIADYERATGRGNANTLEEYRQRVGHARGMVAMLGLFDDLVKTVVREDERDWR